MKIFSFFGSVPEIDIINETKLITIWRERWKRAGFDPEVLTVFHAQQHPRYEEFNNAFAGLPTINPKNYELFCYLRWLAVSAVNQADEWCLMSDYDVLPIEKRLHLLTPQLEKRRDKLTFFQCRNICPSLVAGTSKMFLDVCEIFKAYQPQESDRSKDHGNNFHCSDQYILEARAIADPSFIEQVNIVRLHGEATDETCAIHFANACMAPLKLKPRAQFIPQLLEGYR